MWYHAQWNPEMFDRVIQQLRKAGHVPLVKPYLLATQPLNIKEVNDALYELYVQEEDHEALAAAVVEYTNFDSIEMAQLCVSEHAWFAIDRMDERRVLDWKDKCAEKGRRVGFHLKNEEYHEKVEKFADEDADDPTVSRPTTPAAPAE